MIKVDVLTKEKKWKKYIVNPQKYLNNKINKIKSLLPFLKGKKIFFSVLLSGDRDIKNLNKKFRNKNKATDVLSFPFHIILYNTFTCRPFTHNGFNFILYL